MAVENHRGADLTPLSEMIPLRDAPDHLPRKADGRKYAFKTVVRWAQKGVGGRRLRTRKFGRSLYTTTEWLAAFGEAMAAEEAGAGPVGVAEAVAVHGKWNYAQAEKELREAGFL